MLSLGSLIYLGSDVLNNLIYISISFYDTVIVHMDHSRIWTIFSSHVCDSFVTVSVVLSMLSSSMKNTLGHGVIEYQRYKAFGLVAVPRMNFAHTPGRLKGFPRHCITTAAAANLRSIA